MSMLAESKKNQHEKLCRCIIRGAQKYMIASVEENEVEVRLNEHMDDMRRAIEVKGKGKISVLVHSNEEVNPLEKVFEKAPGGVGMLLLKTSVYDEI
ncbi:hypothetical protein Peur_052219 [Populus x canadensis]